jgi:UDP-glucose 4-epimerase
MAKYLITGIAGFIGSALAHALINQGHQVRGIDNFSTGKPQNLSAIRHRLDFREADLLDDAAMADACEDVDFVLHHAADPSVARSIQDPVASHRVNACGTLNLLLAARKAGVRRFIYASSCSVYGDAPLPNSEGARPQPLSPYAVSKLTGEQYASSFYQLYGLETVALRYFNVFGPRQDANSEYSGVIARFISLMIAGQGPTIFGNGEQSRDFTFIDDVVAANLLACNAPPQQVAGQVFNIGGGNQITINQVYKLISEILPFRGKPAYAPARSGEVRYSYADTSLARTRLKFVPQISFEEGLRQTINWYLQHLNVETTMNNLVGQ